MARDSSGRPQSRAEHEEAAPDEATSLLTWLGPGQNYQALGATGAKGPEQASMHNRRAPPSRGSPAAATEGDECGRRLAGRSVASWTRRTLANLRSIELENKGSVARDHLALERTFLAWLRTSLAFASIGIAVTQLFRLNTTISDGGGGSQNATVRRLGKPLGATFLGISILTLLLGARRYFRGQEWVIRGKFPASRGTVVVVAVAALAIMVVSLVVVIVIHPPEGEL